MMNIKLGYTTKDNSTGFSGVADIKTEFLTGNVQFHLQPKVDKEGKFVPGMDFDRDQLYQLKLASWKVLDCAEPRPTTIELGWKVKDNITGTEGITIRRITYLNGCVYYIVQGKIGKDGAIQEYFFEQARLTKVSDGFVKEIQKKLGTSEAATPGGPTFARQARG